MYVQVELDPEKTAKIKLWIFLKRNNNNSSNQVISDGSNVEKNRHVQFGIIKRSGKARNRLYTFMSSP